MYLDVFNKVVDSDDFTVGGGSASALAGAMAAGMASMVAKLSMQNRLTSLRKNIRPCQKNWTNWPKHC